MEKNRGYNKKLEILKLLIIFLIIFIASSATYYFFFYTETCPDKACFQDSLLKCKKSSWINDASEATWLYVIEKKHKGECKVNVKLLLAKEGKTDISEAEGKEMTCYLPAGIVASPEKDLSKCHGELKESLQEIMITRMHSYILENLEQINEEIFEPL